VSSLVCSIIEPVAVLVSLSVPLCVCLWSNYLISCYFGLPLCPLFRSRQDFDHLKTFDKIYSHRKNPDIYIYNLKNIWQYLYTSNTSENIYFSHLKKISQYFCHILDISTILKTSDNIWPSSIHFYHTHDILQHFYHLTNIGQQFDLGSKKHLTIFVFSEQNWQCLFLHFYRPTKHLTIFIFGLLKLTIFISSSKTSDNVYSTVFKTSDVFFQNIWQYLFLSSKHVTINISVILQNLLTILIYFSHLTKHLTTDLPS